MTTQKTHYRKAFTSPYLSSADIVDPTVLTISKVLLEPDKSKKTKDMFNTAYFTEKELRPGEPLKPMILNAGNSKTMAARTGSKWIDDWQDVSVTVYVDANVRFGRDIVEGLRIAPGEPEKLISAEQSKLLVEKASDVGADYDKFCAFFKVTDTDKLPVSQYKKAMGMLEKKQASSAEAKE